MAKLKDAQDLESFDIDLRDNSLTEGVARSVSVFGTPTASDTPIFIEKAVHARIHEFAQTDTARELGGVLIGSVESSDEKGRVIVVGCIEAKHTKSTKSSLTFTHETWNQIHSEKEQLFPHEKIVGWFHTHPGFGIFLSSHDRFICNNFFNLPWQVAYVVDPTTCAEGFFEWRSGKLEKSGAFYVFDGVAPVGSFGTQEVTPVLSTPSATSQKPVFGVRFMVLTQVASIAVILALVFTIYQERGIHIQRMDEITDISNSALTLAESRIASAEEGRFELEQRVSELEQALASASIHEAVTHFDYTVRAGDTLSRISNIFYGTPSRAEELARVNNLAIPDTIFVGQVIRIPLD